MKAEAYAGAVRDLIVKGKRKVQDIMIEGPANCKETLNSIYKTFSNPSSTPFVWDGAEECECIFLNDLRCSPNIILWHDFLLLQEGQTVHLPAPTTHYSKDITFASDTPLFCTGKYPLVYTRNERESEMDVCTLEDISFQLSNTRKKNSELFLCVSNVLQS